MKHYKDPANNDLYAYESDGSQDEWIKPGLIQITDAEADEIRMAKIAEAEAAMVSVDPLEKLKQFLSANPDVKELLNVP